MFDLCIYSSELLKFEAVYKFLLFRINFGSTWIFFRMGYAYMVQLMDCCMRTILEILFSMYEREGICIKLIFKN